jgi:hypothetical protein
MKGSIWGTAVIATLVVFGASAVNASLPSNPATSTQGIADAINAIGPVWLLLLVGGAAVVTVGSVRIGGAF